MLLLDIVLANILYLSFVGSQRNELQQFYSLWSLQFHSILEGKNMVCISDRALYSFIPIGPELSFYAKVTIQPSTVL